MTASFLAQPSRHSLRAAIFLFLLLPMLFPSGLIHPALAAPLSTALVLRSHAPATAWTNAIAAGAAEEAGDECVILQESLGKGSLDEEGAEAIARKFAKKLSTPIQAVIATDATAGAFAGKYGQELFPNAALVLTGPDRFDPDRLALCEECVALPLGTDIKRMLDLIFTLRPKTALVVGITDGSPQGMAAKAALKRAMEDRKEGVELVFPGHEPGNDEGLDLQGLEQVLAGMPSRSVAVLLHFKEDETGLPVPEERLKTALKSRIGGPVFVLTDALLDTGAVGGVLVTGRDTGRTAIRIAKRILDGESAREMLPEPVAPRVVLDGQALARFGMIPPEGAAVLNPARVGHGPDQIVSGFAPTAAVSLVVFLGLFFMVRRYR